MQEAREQSEGARVKFGTRAKFGGAFYLLASFWLLSRVDWNWESKLVTKSRVYRPFQEPQCINCLAEVSKVRKRNGPPKFIFWQNFGGEHVSANVDKNNCASKRNKLATQLHQERGLGWRRRKQKFGKACARWNSKKREQASGSSVQSSES